MTIPVSYISRLGLIGFLMIFDPNKSISLSDFPPPFVAYVIFELKNRVNAYRMNSTNGELIEVDSVPTIEDNDIQSESCLTQKTINSRHWSLNKM